MSNTNTIIIGYAFIVDMEKHAYSEDRLEYYLDYDGDRVFVDEDTIIIFANHIINKYDPEHGVYPFEDDGLQAENMLRVFEIYEDIFSVKPSHMGQRVQLCLFNNVES